MTSPDFDDVYFQSGQGMAESRYVFLENNGLQDRFAALQDGDAFHIAELGFGTGLNFLLTAALWKSARTRRSENNARTRRSENNARTRRSENNTNRLNNSRLFYAGIEKHPIEKTDLARLYAAWPEMKEDADAILAQYPPLIEGFHHIRLPGIHLMLLFGDVADILPELTGQFDAWYLDGFAPVKNPDMWRDDLFPLIKARTKPGGTLSTFSAAGHVRRGLKAAGFEVKKIKGHGRKWAMTTARLSAAASPPAKQEERKITVLGAGLAGCSVARALADKGCRVTVIDRRESFAQETSGNPVGILYPKLTVDPSPLGKFHGHGFCYTRALLQTLNVPSWNACGVLHLDLDAEDAERSRDLVEKNGWPGDFARVTDAASEIAGIPIAQSALYQPSAGCLSPPEFCAGLLDHPGITTVFGRDVATLDMHESIVVVTLGTASTGFPETARLPLQPFRGQISYVAAGETSRRLKTVICHDGYVIPALDNAHCIGATFQKEPSGLPELRDADHAENLAKLNKNIPALDAGPVTGGRAGYRAATPDRLPLIGPCPDHASFIAGGNGHVKDLYIAAGFGAHGLSGAPLAGEIIAALITGDPLPVPRSLMAHLLPERFVIRDLKRKNI